MVSQITPMMVPEEARQLISMIPPEWLDSRRGILHFMKEVHLKHPTYFLQRIPAKEAALMLGCTSQTLANMRFRGEGPKTWNGSTYIRLAVLQYSTGEKLMSDAMMAA